MNHLFLDLTPEQTFQLIRALELESNTSDSVIRDLLMMLKQALEEHRRVVKIVIAENGKYLPVDN